LSPPAGSVLELYDLEGLSLLGNVDPDVMIAVIVALVSSVEGPKGTAKTISSSRVVF